MKEELIRFETAKLAKEKGFNIPTNKMFSLSIDYSTFNKTDNSEIIKFHDGDKHECANIPYDWNNFNSQTTNIYYSAPTQSLLQKWLREKHNIHIWITRFLISEQEFCYNIENYEGLRQNRGEFETYEEALEIGLQEALKLIK